MEDEVKEAPLSVSDSSAQSQDFASWEPKKKSPLIPIIIIIVLLGLVVGGFLLLRSGAQPATESSPTPEPNVIIEQSLPTPSLSVDKAEIKIKVLNGTGIAGEAGILKDKLTAAGFADVQAGNASRQNYTDAQVSFASSVPEEIRSELVALLNSLYTSVDEKSGVGTGFDVEIITGLRKGVTPKPTASASPSPKSSPTASPTATPKPSATP